MHELLISQGISCYSLKSFPWSPLIVYHLMQYEGNQQGELHRGCHLRSPITPQDPSSKGDTTVVRGRGREFASFWRGQGFHTNRPKRTAHTDMFHVSFSFRWRYLDISDILFTYPRPSALKGKHYIQRRLIQSRGPLVKLSHQLINR